MAPGFFEPPFVLDRYPGTPQQAANYRKRRLDLVVGPQGRRVVESNLGGRLVGHGLRRQKIVCEARSVGVKQLLNSFRTAALYY